MILSASIARAGDTGLLVQFRGEFDAATLLAASRRLRKLADPVATVSGYSSVLLLFEREADAEEARTLLAGVSVLASAGEVELEVDERPLRSRRHRIAVSFAPEDAPDLPEVLSHLDVERGAFLAQVQELSLRVRFRGFLPGFAYLEGLPPSWDVPRRPTSRTRVPRGSFAIASGMAGFYPDDCPGGWNILGRSNATLWDPLRDPPAMLSEGDLVTIEVVDSLPSLEPATFRRHEQGDPLATCVHPGQQTLVVTLADTRRCKRGLPSGGAFDTSLARRANQRVGNPGHAHLLECTLVGPELRFEREGVVAWEGASVALQKNGTTVDSSEVSVAQGDVLRIGRLSGGLRGWLAFSGGGLASVDPPHAASPRHLAKGEVLHRGETSTAAVSGTVFRPRSSRLIVEVIAGPHVIGDEALERLVATEWLVTPSLDRTGVRLKPDGESVSVPASIASCGMQPGTVQLHPNGELVVMGPDHPVTGGYLQPFTLPSSELWKIAQLQPGERLRWTMRD